MIHYKKGYKYQLEADYSVFVGINASRGGINTQWLYLSESGWLTIRKGYAWDGPSGPTIDTKDTLRGSLIHDAIYQLMRLGLLSQSYRDEADDLLRRICIEDGMNPARAKLWYMGVRMFAEPYARYGTERGVLIAP